MVDEDTQDQFAPYELVSGASLDVMGVALGVRRLPAEMDEPYRDRVRDAHRVRRLASRPSKSMESVKVEMPSFDLSRISLVPQVEPRGDEDEIKTDPTLKTFVGPLLPEPSPEMKIRALEKELAQVRAECQRLADRIVEYQKTVTRVDDLRRLLVEAGNAARYGDLERVIKISDSGG